LVVFTLTICR